MRMLNFPTQVFMHNFKIHCVYEEPMSTDMEISLVWKSDFHALGMLMIFRKGT